MEPFVHLHVHTEYSLLDGACRVAELVARAKDLGQSAIAMTDHGVLYGAIAFYQAAVAAGVKPIIGCELYVAPRNRQDKEPGQDRHPYHLTVLCRNNRGYQNLVQLVSRASLEGFYGKPRVDWDLLSTYHEGLLVLSGCVNGEVARRLLDGDYAVAKAVALRYRALFGADGYYLEVHNHGLPEEAKVRGGLRRIAAETGISLVAANDVHYLGKEDAITQKLLVCIQTGTTLQAPAAMTLPNATFYLRDGAEMAELFADCPDAVSNTLRIAEACTVTFQFGVLQLPKYRAEGMTDATAYFRSLCMQGLQKRYGAQPTVAAEERMAYELSVIEKMGYVDYFLIVWDFVQFAKRNDIPVGPGRGSGAGSLCAYCVGITDIDPLKNGLLFERFLNPERVSMPDFDIDFCVEGRQRVIDYVTARYGTDHVAQIIAFDTLKAKAAVRDTGRAMDLPYALCDRVAKCIPTDLQMTLARALEESEELKAMDAEQPQVHQMLHLAQQLEGMPRHASTHAAGVVISAVPVLEQVPLQKNEDAVITQYTMTVLESLGLLKMDFLGLRNLTVIHETVCAIRRSHPQFSMETIPEDDAAVFRMLSKGDSLGVFQMESDGLRRVLQQMRPTSLADLTALISLYRPGPMRSIPQYLAARDDPTTIHYDHPLLEPILSETFGCIVYQEQVMEICRRLAGYSYGRADLVRRAMAKKKHSVMEQERAIFVYGGENCMGAVANGVPAEIANAIFDQMARFASYAFNKSHAASYARLAYETAYLKCRYFSEYLAALMNSVLSNTQKLLEYIGVCEAHGVSVRRPDINSSQAGFAAVPDGIRFGLLAIRGMGSNAIESCLAERAENGAYHSLREFCARTADLMLGKRGVEGLIRAGAFDGLGWNRRQMLELYEPLMNAMSARNRQVLRGQLSLFGGDDAEEAEPTIECPAVPEYPEQELLRMEKEMTGLYLSGHPLARWAAHRQLLRMPELADLPHLREGTVVSVLCLLSDLRTHLTRNNEKMAFFQAEDLTGSVECLVFPSLYPTVATLLEPDRVLCLSGKCSLKDDKCSLLCNAVQTEAQWVKPFADYMLCVKLADGDTECARAVTDICRRWPGETTVSFWMLSSRRYLVPRAVQGVTVCNALLHALTERIPASNCALLPRKSLDKMERRTSQHESL